MHENIGRLKKRVYEDLHSDNEKTRLTALVVRIMLITSERVGNDASAHNGHFGITELKPRHISLSGNKVTLKYVGKSAVKHVKEFSDATVARELKKLLRQPYPYVFTTSDGFRIHADKVNRYLSRFDVTSKDIRGYNSNRLMIMKLKEKGTIVDEKERKKIFNEELKKVAAKIGHKPATLRTHYLLPEIEESFYKNGRLGKIKNLSS